MSYPNPKYTFSNFVIYEGNKIVYLSFLKLAEVKGLFNPFFFFSADGMGKTHLLSAFANNLIEQNKKEDFYFFSPKEFFEFLKNKNNIRKGNWILIDDFHEFVELEKAQELLLEQFDSLLSMDIQMIFSSLFSLKELKEKKKISSLLRERIQAGIEVQIAPFNFEDKKILIREKAKLKGIELQEKDILLLAKKDFKNVREIEGDLNKLLVSYIVKGGSFQEDIVKIATQSDTGSSLLFPELLDELEASIARVIESAKEEEDLKKAFKEKVYIWEMKGFKTERLRKLFECEDVKVLKKEYTNFVKNIEELIELQRKYGEMDISDAEVEKWLFDPDRVEDIKKWMEAKITEKATVEELEIKQEEKEYLEEEIPVQDIEEIFPVEEIKEEKPLLQEFHPVREVEIIKGEFNREVIDALGSLKELVNSEKHHSFCVFSEGHNGITTHLEWAFYNLPVQEKIFLSSQELAENLLEEKKEFIDALVNNYKVLFIDDIPLLFEIEEIREKTEELFKSFQKKNKLLVLGSNRSPFNFLNIEYKPLKLSFPEKEVLEKIFNRFSEDREKTFTPEAKHSIISASYRDLKDFTDKLLELLTLPKGIIEIYDIPWEKAEVPIDKYSPLYPKILFQFESLDELLYDEL